MQGITLVRSPLSGRVICVDRGALFGEACMLRVLGVGWTGGEACICGLVGEGWPERTPKSLVLGVRVAPLASGTFGAAFSF